MARRTATSYRGRGTQTAGESDTGAPNGGQKGGSVASATAEDKGLGLAEALILSTTVLLFAAILLTDAYLGQRYGAGIFFK